MKHKESYRDVESKENWKIAQVNLSQDPLQQTIKAQNEHLPESTSTDTSCSHMTVKQLKDKLKKRNAKGFSSKNKAELIKQLEENLSIRKYKICSILGAWNDFSYSKGDSLTHSKL